MKLGIANAEYSIHYEAAKKSTAKYLKVRCGATEDVEARIQNSPVKLAPLGCSFLPTILALVAQD